MTNVIVQAGSVKTQAASAVNAVSRVITAVACHCGQAYMDITTQRRLGTSLSTACAVSTEAILGCHDVLLSFASMCAITT